MKSALTLTSILLLLVCSGCGDSPDKLAADSVDAMKDLVSILEGVKDEASATAAKPKLQALRDRMRDLNARQDKLKLSEAEKDKVQAKYKTEMETVMQKLLAEGMRISADPQLAPVMQGMDDIFR